jgi:hypothetical protein
VRRLCLVFALSACTADGFTTITGLDPAKNLSALSDDEQKKGCDAILTYFETSAGAAARKVGCYGEGFDAAKDEVDPDTFKTTCETAYNTCMDQVPAQDTCAAVDEGNDCTATVADLEACWESRVSAYNAVASKYTCDIEDEDAFTAEDAYNTTACVAFAKKCPAWDKD